MGIKSRYEMHHNLTITDEAVEAAVRLSSRYISDRFLPDKAIDLDGRGIVTGKAGNLQPSARAARDADQAGGDGIQIESASDSKDFERAARVQTRNCAWKPSSRRSVPIGPPPRTSTRA